MGLEKLSFLYLPLGVGSAGTNTVLVSLDAAGLQSEAWDMYQRWTLHSITGNQCTPIWNNQVWVLKPGDYTMGYGIPQTTPLTVTYYLLPAIRPALMVMGRDIREF